MRVLFLLLNIIFSTTFLTAQEDSKKIYLVYLKDGSFLKGKLIKSEADQFKVYIQAQEPIIISKKIIRSIEPIRNKYFFLENGLSFKNKYYFNAVTLEIFASPDANSLGLHTTNAYFINPTMALGVGLGIDIYDAPNNGFSNFSFIPISIHFRNYIFNRKISPYYAVDAGWGIPVGLRDNYYYNNTNNGGLMGKLGLGIRFAARKKSNFILETGYRFQKTTIEYQLEHYQNGSTIDVREVILFKRLTLGLGYIF